MKNWINKFFKKKEELKEQKEHSLLDIDTSQWSDDNKILFAQKTPPLRKFAQFN